MSLGTIIWAFNYNKSDVGSGHFLIPAFMLLAEVSREYGQYYMLNHSKPFRMNKHFGVVNVFLTYLAELLFEFGGGQSACNPESWFQIHATWHIVSAIFLFNNIMIDYFELEYNWRSGKSYAPVVHKHKNNPFMLGEFYSLSLLIYGALDKIMFILRDD